MYLKSIRIFFLVLIMAILASLAAMQLQPVKDFAIKKSVDWLANRIGYGLKVDDVELMLPFEIILKKPQIDSPGDEPVFKAESITIRVNPYSFISRELHIHSLIVDEPVFFAGKGSDKPGIKEFEKYLPPFAISINHLQLKGLKTEEWSESFVDKGLYTIDAKFEYEPEDGYAFASVKIWNEETKEESLNGSAALFADEEIGFVGFEAYKTRGIIKGIAYDIVGRVSGNLSGTYAEWLRCIRDPTGFDNYTLEGQLRASWNYFKKEEENRLSALNGGMSASLKIGGEKWAQFKDLEITTPLFDVQSVFSLGADFTLDGTEGIVSIKDAGRTLALFNLQNDLEAKGALKVGFALEGSKTAPRGKFDVTALDFEILGKTIEKLSSSLSLSKEGDSLSGDLDLKIDDSGEHFISTLRFKTDLESVLELERAALELPWGRGELDLFINKQGLIRSKAKALITDLGFLKTVLDQNVEGVLQAELNLSTDSAGQSTINLIASSENIAVDHMKASGVKVKIEAEGCPGRIFCGGELTAESMDLFNEKFSDIKLVVQPGDKDSAIPYQLSLNYLDRPLLSSGHFTAEKSKLKVLVQKMTGSFRTLDLILKEPFEVALDTRSFETTPLFLSVGKGSLFTSADMREDSWHFSLRFKDIPCGVLPFEEIFDQHLEGDAEGDAFLYGTFDHLQGQIRLDVHDLFAIEDANKNIPLLKGSLSASLIENRMEAKGEISGIGDAPLKFEAALPLSLGLKAPFYHLDMDSLFSARVEAEGALTPLLELLIVDAASFSGNGKIEMEAEGTINAPKIKGGFTLTNGLFEIAELGTQLTGIEAVIKGEGGMLYLQSLKASDGGGGILTGSGRMRLSFQDSFPFQIDLNLVNAKPVHVNLFDGEANGHLTCSGTLEKAELKGSLEIQKGRLLLPKKIPETSVSYPVRYINEKEARLKPTVASLDNGLDFPMDVDIDLSIKDSFSIVDEDLQSTWKGKVQIQGPVLKPQLNGEIKLIGGDYLLNGKQFTLSQGRLVFNGDFEKKSSLYVSLSRDIQEYEVEIILKGSLKDPDILLRSRPALPTQQVLSLILFGRTASEINELQEEQLEQSLSNLTNSDKTDDTLTKFQKTLGIDHIEFMRSSESSQQVCIKVGKYISRNVYLSVSRDSAEEVNAISLEAQIQKNIKAQIEAQDNAEGQFSIFWKKNY